MTAVARTRWDRGLDAARVSMIREAMGQARGRVSDAARWLGVMPQTLHYWLGTLDLRDLIARERNPRKRA